MCPDVRSLLDRSRSLESSVKSDLEGVKAELHAWRDEPPGLGRTRRSVCRKKPRREARSAK